MQVHCLDSSTQRACLSALFHFCVGPINGGYAYPSPSESIPGRGWPSPQAVPSPFILLLIIYLTSFDFLNDILFSLFRVCIITDNQSLCSFSSLSLSLVNALPRLSCNAIIFLCSLPLGFLDTYLLASRSIRPYLGSSSRCLSTRFASRNCGWLLMNIFTASDRAFFIIRHSLLFDLSRCYLTNDHQTLFSSTRFTHQSLSLFIPNNNWQLKTLIYTSHDDTDLLRTWVPLITVNNSIRIRR